MMNASVEIVFQHKFKNNKYMIAAFDSLEYSMATHSQNSSSVCNVEAVCNVRSEERSKGATSVLKTGVAHWNW